MPALTPNLPLLGQNVVLAITGSVAACKADRVIRSCQEAGADVRVVLTDAGQHFFTPYLAGALTEAEVYTNQFGSDRPGRMPHIELKRWADAVLVAPATANRLLNLAQPEANDLLSTVLHAFNGPVLYAPAMNPDMWNDEEIQAILEKYRDNIIEPDEGEMACGDIGPGRFPDPRRIVERLIERLWPSPLSGEKWVVSAGPTRERWDNIRYLTNRSSGRMGACLARVGCWLGANVELVTGASSQQYPYSSRRIQHVETAEEMLSVVLEKLTADSGYIGAAAVSDYRPSTVEGKVESDQEDLSIPLEKNPDIIREIRSEFPEIPVIGFSADDSDEPDRAVEKANEKGMDAVVFNSLSQQDGGMGSEKNRAMFCLPDGTIHPLGSRTKIDLACQVWLSQINLLC